MNARSLIFLIGSIVGVALIVLFTRSYLTGLQQAAQSAPVEAPKSEILVAARNLPRGTILGEKDLKAMAWPDNAMAETYIRSSNPREDIKALIGKVIREPVAQELPVTNNAVVSIGERGYMAAILTPGMRAVTIRIKHQSAVGGFIFPGDRVDVILTQTVSGVSETANGPVQSDHRVSETILKNVRVLAVDQRSEAGPNEIRVGKSATLEVTPKVAEKVAMFESLGELTFALRSLGADGEPTDTLVARTEGFSEGSEVSNFLKGYNAAEDLSFKRVMVRRGGASEQLTIDARTQSPTSVTNLTPEIPTTPPPSTPPGDASGNN